MSALHCLTMVDLVGQVLRTWAEYRQITYTKCNGLFIVIIKMHYKERLLLLLALNNSFWGTLA